MVYGKWVSDRSFVGKRPILRETSESDVVVLIGSQTPTTDDASGTTADSSAAILSGHSSLHLPAILD